MTKQLNHIETNRMLKSRNRQLAFLPVHKQKEESRLSKIVNTLTKIPSLVEDFKKEGHLVLDLNDELIAMLKSGELQFGKYVKNGENYAQLINSSTGHVFSNIPIKQLPAEMGSQMANMGMEMQLQEIVDKLNQLEDKINQVNRNFDLNRFAEVQSAQEKLNFAYLTKSKKRKQTFLEASLLQAINAKNLLLNQVFEYKDKLYQTKDQSNPLSKSYLSAAESEELAQSALENMYYLIEAFYIQIMSINELEEYSLLQHTLTEFNQLIFAEFSKDEALYLDGQLSDNSNPFKYLTNDLVKSTQAAIDYAYQNHELLDIQFISEDLEEGEEYYD